jgi:transcriptional regulator with XRE-family HTH domain
MHAVASVWSRDLKGDALKRARKAQNLKQWEVARAMGVSQATVSNWEVGRSKPTRDEARSLQDLFGGEAAPSHGAAEKPSGNHPAASFGDWVVDQRVARGWTQTQLAKKAELSQAAISNIEIGRSPNPLASTRKRIEAALGLDTPASVAAEQERVATVEDVGVLRDFDPHDPSAYPNEPGVYVFYDRSDRPIYVGESKSISARVKSHADKFWFKEPIVDTAAYVAISDETLRRQVEAVLIAFLRSNAVLNTRGTGRAKR